MRVLLQVEIDEVRPDPATAAAELRLLASLLPLRVRADQRVVQFLAAFFAPAESAVLVTAPSAGDSDLSDAAEDDACGAVGPTGELCSPHVQAWYSPCLY